MAVLEARDKDNQCIEDYDKLQDLYRNLNTLDAQRIGHQLLRKNQRIFEYRDKPGKCLSYLLAGTPE